MQLVTLNQLDQLTGILGIGGVTTSFQSMRPTHIVRWLELKERLVVRSVSDEVRVILVGLFYGGVLESVPSDHHLVCRDSHPSSFRI